MNARRGVEQIAAWTDARDLDLRHDEASGHGAVFSRCGRYRYLLWRDAFARQEMVGFAILNPSRADHRANDPTIARCHRRARGMGRALLVWNLFALMETAPARLKRRRLPAGPHNDAAIALALRVAGRTIAAWGVHGGHRGRHDAALALCRSAGAELDAFGLTRHGFPRHLLYLPNETRARGWNYRQTATDVRDQVSRVPPSDTNSEAVMLRARSAGQAALSIPRSPSLR